MRLNVMIFHGWKTLLSQRLYTIINTIIIKKYRNTQANMKKTTFIYFLLLPIYLFYIIQDIPASISQKYMFPFRVLMLLLSEI